MEPVNLFDLAARQSRWLAARQAAVAGNIANVSTPGYGAVDVQPFEKVLGGSSMGMKATQAGHLTGRSAAGGFATGEAQQKVSLLPSENSVVLENELMKAGEIRRQFELNTAIVKAFHRMVMLSTKG